MTEPRITVAWRAREEPLAPAAVAARGRVATALARRLLTRDDEALARLSGVAGPGLLVLLGGLEELPWADGVTYLGRDPAAPSLLLPTALEPDVPPQLFERALSRVSAGLAPPIVLLLDPPLVASAAGARPVVRESLLEWLDGEV